MDTAEFLKKVKEGSIDIVENTGRLLESCRKLDKSHHLFNTLCEKEAMEQAESLNKDPKGKLAGLCISVKDCICVKDVESTAGSMILKGYKPLFDATAVERARKEGAIIIGKTAQDEFGFGGFSVNTGVGFEKPLNPLDPKRSCGGSSGGAAGLTKALEASASHIALGQSTGGSIACPASFCGVVGFTPTYGLVSRWGLIDYGNSLDKIGPLSATVPDSALMLDIIAGHDIRDSTSVNTDTQTYTSSLGKDIKGMKIGIIKENLGEGIEPYAAKAIRDAADFFDAEGASCEEISLPKVNKYGIPAYYLIAMTEASTNLARYCGMRYGYHSDLGGGFNEYFSKVRSAAMGKEAKRRIMLGTFARMAGFRDAYYIKAMKLRTMIINEYKHALKKFDALLSPTMPMVSPRFDEIEKLTPLRHYMADICTAPVNLAGLPHISMPCGTEDKMPIGMMLISEHFNETRLFTLADHFERKI